MERCSLCKQNVMRMPTQFAKVSVTIDPNPSPAGTVRVEQAKAFVLGDGQAELARADGESLYSIHPKVCTTRSAR